MSAAPETPRAARTKLVLALAAVYVLWGSTYVAIRIAIETIPPLTMAGTRFTIAGLALMGFARSRASGGATWKQWRNALVAGAFLMMASNGLVCWSETRVDSSLAALLVATVPLWMMLLDWWRPGGTRPQILTIAGVAVGLAGVVVLVWPTSTDVRIDPAGVVALLTATLCWSIGSIFTRSADLPRSMLLATSMQMLCGGLLQLLLGFFLGEWRAFEIARVTLDSMASVVYLIVFGSLVGFTAYIWLLRNTTPTRAATYAFVNPIVAVLLGAWLLDEKLSARRLLGALVIVLGVVLVIAFKGRTRLGRRATSEIAAD